MLLEVEFLATNVPGRLSNFDVGVNPCRLPQKIIFFKILILFALLAVSVSFWKQRTWTTGKMRKKTKTMVEENSTGVRPTINRIIIVYIHEKYVSMLVKFILYFKKSYQLAAKIKKSRITFLSQF